MDQGETKMLKWILRAPRILVISVIFALILIIGSVALMLNGICWLLIKVGENLDWGEGMGPWRE